jgi:hypothetical protein
MAQNNFNIHNKIKIASDVSIDLPDHFKVSDVKTPDLVVRKGHIKFEGMEFFAPLYTFFGKRHLIHKYGFLIPCELSLRDLESKTKIDVTEPYYKIVPNAKQLVESVVNLKLLQKGMLRIHGAGVQWDKKGILVLGWDGIGKSSVVSRFMRAGGKYIGEEHVFIDSKFAYSYPIKIKTFKGHNFISKRLNTVPYVNRFLGVYRRETAGDVLDKSKIKYVFLAKYGKHKIRKIPKSELMKDMMILNEYSSGRWMDGKSLILAYSYHNNYNLEKLLGSRKEIMRQFLRGTRCFEISSENATDLIKSIDDVLSV